MKKILALTSVFVVMIGMFFSSCTNENEGTAPIDIQKEISAFESQYFQTVKTRTNEVKLFGFKTMNLSEGKDREVVKWVYTKYKKEIDQMKGVFIASDFSFYRIYFPMHTAIVNYMGKEYKANANGIVELPRTQTRGSINSIEIVGRIKSDKVAGCGSNIITPDKIILKEKLIASKSDEGMLLFDMGPINCCEKSTSMNKTPCIENHRPHANCSDAFGIWGVNCVTDRGVCMDFNGWGSDCTKGPKTYFLGSDCQVAMMRGHCWNEIM